MSRDAFRSIVRSVLGVLFVSVTALLAIELPLGGSLVLCSLMSLAFVILAVVDRQWTALIGIAVGTLELALFLPGPGFAVKDPLDALTMIIAISIGLIVAWFSRTQRSEIWRLCNELRKVAADEHDGEERLKEISHRLTNDFSMLVATASSIGRRAESQETRAAMTEFSTRVVVLGRIYRRLWASEARARGVNMRRYLQELCDDLQLVRFNSQPITIQLEAEDIEVPLRSATLLGLITNELLTNVSKHAFPDGSSGLVTVSLRRAPPQMLLLDVVDDGVGFKRPVGQCAGLGHRLLVALAAQLHGAISYSRIEGKTVVSVSFPMDSAEAPLPGPIDDPRRSIALSPAVERT